MAPGSVLTLWTLNRQADDVPGRQVPVAPHYEELGFEHELTPANTVSYQLGVVCGL